MAVTSIFPGGRARAGWTYSVILSRPAAGSTGSGAKKSREMMLSNGRVSPALCSLARQPAGGCGLHELNLLLVAERPHTSMENGSWCHGGIDVLELDKNCGIFLCHRA